MKWYGLVEGGDKRGELVEEKDFMIFSGLIKPGQYAGNIRRTGEPAATLEDVYQAIRFVTKVYKDNSF